MIWALIAACAVASVPAGLRWLRVAQREHYLSGSVTRTAFRWARVSSLNLLILALGFAGLVITVVTDDDRWAWAVPGVVAVWPIGLTVRGVSAPLAWTARLRRLAVSTGVLLGASLFVGSLFDLAGVVAFSSLVLPAIVDLGLWLLSPYEGRIGDRWVVKAASKLRSVGAEVVAITGSYGKTTTKHYVAHLLSGSKRVVASPASFNNRMGLARAINENLTAGTEVFVAEMGTYGPGEIAELCEWITPKVAAIVAIGPVHLERFGSEEKIVRAKAEILERAATGVICVDHPLLARLSSERGDRMPIVEVSGEGGIVVAGERMPDPPDGVFAANLAVALGICVALGTDLAQILPRMEDLPGTEHRQSVLVGEGGFTIIDDTFNSNPAGARSALEAVLAAGEGGKTALVTPGMVELGHLQSEENRRYAEDAASVVDHVIIVGRTNRRALRRGSSRGRASVTVVASRDEAVEWVRANLGPGDAVLYENDLPDHYP